MGAVEEAIDQMVRELVEENQDIPSEEDIERITDSRVESFMDRSLSDLLDGENVIRSHDMDNLRNELLREVQTRTIRYQSAALKDKIKGCLIRVFTGQRKNGRKFCLWTILMG